MALCAKAKANRLLTYSRTKRTPNLAYVDATDRFLDKLVDVEAPENMVERQPFPGPGLGVRCLGAITCDRLEALPTPTLPCAKKSTRQDSPSGSTSP